MDMLEVQIKKKKEEICSLQKRLKKKKNELKELELKLETAEAKKQAAFNAKVVEEMEQRFGKFTEESLGEFLKNLDAGSSVKMDSTMEVYKNSMDCL